MQQPTPTMSLTYRPFDKLPQIEELRQELRKNVPDAERIISALSGLALLASGFYRGGLAKWALSAAGMALVQRGLTGHCPLYEQMEVSSRRSHAK
jgi:uncharacterized membrane protein